MDKVSESILALRPVTFRYREALDPNKVPQFGLIAEEVAKVNADLVTRDDKGEIYSVRYEAVNAMLLNEFLKEHRRVEQLESEAAEQRQDFTSTVRRQENEIEALTKMVKQQAAQIEKVSAQISLQESRMQTIASK